MPPSCHRADRRLDQDALVVGHALTDPVGLGRAVREPQVLAPLPIDVEAGSRHVGHEVRDRARQHATVRLTIEIASLKALGRILEKLGRVVGVIAVRRHSE